jgi:endonuclease/exonuclease/phosphatase family metal-dependent hydrolase
MRVVTYNIRFAWGLDGRVDLERIAESVRDADIIALQEVERFWRRSGMSDQPAELARLLDGYYWVYGPAFDVDASERGPNGEIANRRRQFGTMVLARWPILASRLLVLPKCATVHHFNMDLGALECVIDTTLGPLRVYSLHLSSLSAPERLVQIERLLDRHREAAASGGPWTGDFKIQDPAERDQSAVFNWSNGESPPAMPSTALLLGDFNSEPDSAEYERIVGPVDPAMGRVGYSGGFVDSWSAANGEAQEDFTWWPDPPERSPQRGMRLDYCFASAELAGTIRRAWIDQAAQGSDHRPYWVEFAAA